MTKYTREMHEEFRRQEDERVAREREERQEPSERLSWWRRWFGG